MVQRWDANVRAVVTTKAGVQYDPLFTAAMCTAHSVVAFFPDECGVDVNMTTPRTKETVLHAFIRSKPIAGRREALRMLKYLLEEKGADYKLQDAHGC